MKNFIEFGQNKVWVDAEDISTTQGGFILTGPGVRIQPPSTPSCYYRHGWQSWSLAAWTNLQPLPVQKPALLRPMQVDPLYARHPSPNGSWLGAVDFADGNILFLGALGLDSHVQLREGQLQGWYESVAQVGNLHHWFVAYGLESEVFSAYAQLLEQRFGKGRIEKPYRIWCSWYSLYTAIDEKILFRTFDDLSDLPFDVLQVDDGWQI
jgi:alpha-galactosidase